MHTEELDSPPALAPLYGRALARSLLPGGGEALPDRRLVLRAAGTDGERLADYARVCGFVLRDRLPPTYPHILGFPLAMALMTDRSFPFALLGMVHVANSIEQLRPIPTGAATEIRVWAEGLRPHRRGRQFDLVTEAVLDADTAWRERSVYLRPGGGGGDAGESARPQEAAAGRDASTSAVWRIPGDIGRRYAQVSGDRNPIHLHPLSARVFGFPGAIAHGMWSKARCLASFDGRLPDAFTASVEFRAPLRIPGRARMRTIAVESGWRISLEPPEGGRPHLTGSIETAA